MGANPGTRRVTEEFERRDGPKFMDFVSAQAESAAEELSRGLLQPGAIISPKFFYDPLGSALFTAICELQEYYPTRTEASIVSQYLPDLRSRLPRHATLVDLGAGDCTKAARLIAHVEPHQYVAVDISSEFTRTALGRLGREYPDLSLLGLGMDFSRELKLPADVVAHRRVFLYPGSSIGNFSPPEAGRLLKQIRRQCDAEGGLLIGVDLVKSAAMLERAYDDALGVTAAFNLNVLRHVNRLLGSDFDIADWRHVAHYNEEHRRIEMHLEARRTLEVTWSAARRRFQAGERIHTENSYKYSPESFEALLGETDFEVDRFWTDENGWFGVFFARPV